MPPPDSLFQQPLPGHLHPDTVFSTFRNDTADSFFQHLTDQSDNGYGLRLLEAPQFLMPEWMMFLVVLFIIFLFYVLAILWPQLMEKKNLSRIKKEAATDLQTNHLSYDECLQQYNPYYAALPADLKERFLLRTITFMRSKEFRFHELPYEPYIPLLISGAAVQLTFGLKNYLMDYFPVIHVIRKEYVLKMDRETYYGHVSHSGIYIAWNHFLEGYSDYYDSINVGLHEMAHAISFDVFLGQCDHHDYAFRSRLEEFAEEGRPVFRAMRQGMSHLLDDYGATNFDEFWAVCVETFFENPGSFYRQMPDLYFAVAELLNQDPLRTIKIIDNELAGLA